MFPPVEAGMRLDVFRKSLLVVFVSCLASAGCTSGSRPHEDLPAPPESIAACDAYLSAYRGCLARFAGGGGDDLERRTALLRETFTVGARDPTARAELDPT